MRGRQTVINMIAATVVVMLGVAAVYIATLRTESDQVTTVDFGSQLSLARAQASSFTPLRPLPAEKWKVTSAAFSRANTVENWRVGVHLPSGDFAWIEQVDGEIDQALARWSRNGQAIGSIDVLGVPRQQWESGSWRALTFSDEGVALGVYGKASFRDLVDLAQSLSGS